MATTDVQVIVTDLGVIEDAPTIEAISQTHTPETEQKSPPDLVEEVPTEDENEETHDKKEDPREPYLEEDNRTEEQEEPVVAVCPLKRDASGLDANDDNANKEPKLEHQEQAVVEESEQ